MLLTSTRSTSDTSSSWWMRGVMSMLTPMFSYTNDVIGCWLMPPVAMGANVVTGTGTRSPKRACAGSPSEVLRRGLASARVFVSFFNRR